MKIRKIVIIEIMLAVIVASFVIVTIIKGVVSENSFLRRGQHKYEITTVEDATCEDCGEERYQCVDCSQKMVCTTHWLGHEPTVYPSNKGEIEETTCRRCGSIIYAMYNKKTGVRFTAKKGTRTETAVANVTNSKGYQYRYKFFWQLGEFEEMQPYFPKHGCSDCALTAVLTATVPELENYTPDRVIYEIQKDVFGESVFNKNYSKALKSQMPISLYGMTKVFDKYNVSYTLPTKNQNDYEEEIRKHLKKGDPVIVTFGRGADGHLSRRNHTVVLIGIDSNGYVIIGDSVKKSAEFWGQDGMIKTQKLTVKDMVSFIVTDTGWTINSNSSNKEKHCFYAGPEDRGYLLINGGKKY